MISDDDDSFISNTESEEGFGGRGSGIEIGKKKYAPNAIFRVVSCLYILYDLTCSIWWKNSTHSLSYMAYRCFAKIVTSD